MEQQSTVKKKRFPLLRVLAGLALAVLLGLIFGGEIPWFSDTPPIEILNDMDDQFKVKPQVGSTFYADRMASRELVPNTFPRNGVLYPLDKSDFEFVDSIIGANPLQRTDFVLNRGQNRFETMCAPCHGNDMHGEGTVVKKGFQQPPSLLAENSRGLTDAHLFHIISAGQNLMPGYAEKLPVNDRWTIVQYIRSMQESKPVE
ncbi:cytochrome c [Ignavibacteria bacterium]|nr:cytochrome c [Bacteroidota bacterium]MCZ2131676.1 cytochrome c [Bacteroidota bacterium]